MAVQYLVTRLRWQYYVYVTFFIYFKTVLDYFLETGTSDRYIVHY